MSDEIKTGTTININAVPKCIDESATALAKPTATEIGSLLKDIIYLKASEIHFQAEKMRITYECELKLFKESVTQALETKPSECLVEPRLQIVGQTAEKARFCIEEPEIREMFKNLLVNAADIRYQSKIHPSFAGIIEQMAPLDAQNLALFKKQDSYPIVEYHMVFDNRQYNIKYPNTFLANPNEPDYDLQAASISSLERHGLIQTNYTVTRLILKPPSWLQDQLARIASISSLVISSITVFVSPIFSNAPLINMYSSYWLLPSGVAFLII